jgi:hypothetical protein
MKVFMELFKKKLSCFFLKLLTVKKLVLHMIKASSGGFNCFKTISTDILGYNFGIAL